MSKRHSSTTHEPTAFLQGQMWQYGEDIIVAPAWDVMCGVSTQIDARVGDTNANNRCADLHGTDLQRVDLQPVDSPCGGIP